MENLKYNIKIGFNYSRISHALACARFLVLSVKGAKGVGSRDVTEITKVIIGP